MTTEPIPPTSAKKLPSTCTAVEIAEHHKGTRLRLQNWPGTAYVIPSGAWRGSITETQAFGAHDERGQAVWLSAGPAWQYAKPVPPNMDLATLEASEIATHYKGQHLRRTYWEPGRYVIPVGPWDRNQFLVTPVQPRRVRPMPDVWALAGGWVLCAAQPETETQAPVAVTETEPRFMHPVEPLPYECLISMLTQLREELRVHQHDTSTPLTYGLVCQRLTGVVDSLCVAITSVDRLTTQINNLCAKLDEYAAEHGTEHDSLNGDIQRLRSGDHY